MMELIPNIFIRMCIIMNAHHFMCIMAVVSKVPVWCMNAAMKRMACKYKVMFLFKPFELILNCFCLRVQEAEIYLSQIGTVIFLGCFPVY